MVRPAPLLPAIALCLGLSLTACAITPANPYPPVPPRPAEAMPLPPVTTTPLIWQPGHWDWTGAGYAWRPGQFVPRGDHSNEWLPEHWALVGSTWVWQPAHWL
jgi:hypothetical protein